MGIIIVHAYVLDPARGSVPSSCHTTQLACELSPPVTLCSSFPPRISHSTTPTTRPNPFSSALQFLIFHVQSCP